MLATLYTDGGARGNPGPAGIGFVLSLPDQEPILYAEYIGQATNNQAEYRALIAGLARADQEKIQQLEVFLDSQLLVEQMKGVYRVKNAGLRPLHDQAKSVAAELKQLTFIHVPREQNKLADKLVNEAIDKHLSNR